MLLSRCPAYRVWISNHHKINEKGQLYVYTVAYHQSRVRALLILLSRGLIRFPLGHLFLNPLPGTLDSSTWLALVHQEVPL